MAENKRFADERADLHPRSWLSRYRRTSIGYLVKMLLFYHGIGVVLLLVGSAIIEQVLPDYQQPSISRSLSGVIMAGPLEETIFFGIPFYAVGSAYFVLVTGALWAGSHLLNTNTYQLDSLAFGSLLFVLPSLFFSLRTWVSGKGWFAIASHSAWNLIFFSLGCTASEFTCTLVDEDTNFAIISALASAGLLAATWALYRWRESRERQRLAA